MTFFDGNISSLYQRLDDSCVYHVAGTAFVIEEKREGAEAVIEIKSKLNAFHVKGDQNAFPILRNKKCADYLVFFYDNTKGKWYLHIFEFTKSVDNTSWEEKIVRQFDGGLLNAYAIGGVLKVPEFEEITMHCGYRRDRNMASLVNMKAPLGRPAHNSWTAETTVELPSFPGLKYAKNLIRLNPENGEGPTLELP